MATLIRGDGHPLHVFLDRCPGNGVDAAVVTEVDDLAPLRLKDAAHDVDRGVVTVEQARGGDETDRVPGLAHGSPREEAISSWDNKY